MNSDIFRPKISGSMFFFGGAVGLRNWWLEKCKSKTSTLTTIDLHTYLHRDLHVYTLLFQVYNFTVS